MILKYILYFQQMQLLKKRFRVCIIPAVCHDEKGTFLQFWYAIPFKALVCNSEMKVRKDQRILHQSYIIYVYMYYEYIEKI